MLLFGELFTKSYLSLTEIETALKKCDCIKYAAYRSAAKLRVIQKALYLDKVHLKLISCVFEKHQLQQTENSVQLDQKELESILSDIYFVVKRENYITFDVEYISQLMINILLNIYDKKKKDNIQVLSLKVGLTLFCQAKPREKYHYLFEQLADHNNCLSKKKLEILLKKMISVTEYIGEGLSFGFELIQGTVESCFQCNIGSLGISEDAFITWLMQDPQLLVWLSTLYRMQISESVSHNVKCGVCKIYPLVGMRYQCLRCLSYNMCQSCFFTRKLNKKHKVKHPVQEYCHPMTSQQSTKAFLLTLRNRLYKKDSKLQYLPALRVDSKETEALGLSTTFRDDMEISSKTLINGSRTSLRALPYKELQNIILELERESEKIIPQIEIFCSSLNKSETNEYQCHLKNCLLKHKAQVKAQVRRLKLFRNRLTSYRRFDAKAFLASTPVVDEILSKAEKKTLNRDLVNVSPITGKKMMWDNYDLVRWDLDFDSCAGANTAWEEVKSENREDKIFEARPVQGSSEDATGPRDENFAIPGTGAADRLPRESEWGSGMRLTWLRESGDGEEEWRKMAEGNEETFQELQADLRKILDKLQELSVVTLEETGGEVSSGNGGGEKTAVAEMETLLADLIKGIESLIGG